jgi:hypothetical protein
VANFGTYTLAEVAAQVKAPAASFRSWDGLPLDQAAELTRYWKVDNHLHERVLAFLDLYADAEHFNAAAPATECHAITNPAASQGVSVTGLYRVARNYTDPNEPGKVFQLLRKGWITSLVATTTVDFSEARVAAGEGGSLVTAPAGAGAGTSRRRVLKVSWTGVAATSAHTIVESLLGLASSGTPWNSVTIRGESYGSGWIRLNAAHRPADDGSAVVEVILAQPEACFEFFSNKGLKGETAEAVLQGVPADLVKTYVENWRKYGALSGNGTAPRGGSVSGSVDLDSGQASLRFSWKPTTAAKGAMVTSMYVNANVWQVHFIAWNQPGTNLSLYVAADMSGLGLAGNEVALEAARAALGGATGWFTCNVAIGSVAKAEWSLAGFDYDPETELFSWHTVWRPVPETYIDDRSAYTSKWEKREWFWDDPAAGEKYLTWEEQVCGTQFKHTWDLFSTYAAAWSFRDQSCIPDVPFPRQVGMYWLAVKVTLHSCTGWIEAGDHSSDYNAEGWHNRTVDVDYQRYIGPAGGE